MSPRPTADLAIALPGWLASAGLALDQDGVGADSRKKAKDPQLRAGRVALAILMQAESPKVPIRVLRAVTNEVLILDALRAGALGYLFKAAPLDTGRSHVRSIGPGHPPGSRAGPP